MTIARPPFAEGHAHPPVHHHPFRRRFAHLSRLLHLYLSMASFAILLFFAATGFTLNHQDWFTKQQRTTQSHRALDPRWVSGNVDKLQIVEFLRRKDGLRGALDDFHIDDSQCLVSFKGPGYEADVAIDRTDGRYDITETNAGPIAILNDLHKGRDAGKVWSRVIDTSAILMSAVSLTGLLLIVYLHKRRVPGLIVLACGAVLAYLIYAVAVP